MQEIVIIAAMAANRVIGRGNALPWSLKADMARFRELTTSWPCVMGRKTWESLPKRPLPRRPNVIVSASMGGLGGGASGGTAAGAEVAVVPSLSAAIDYCAAWQKVFICGGASVYRQAMDFANRIELTVLHQDYEGDAFFPEVDKSCWAETAREDFDTFSFVSYTKNVIA